VADIVSLLDEGLGNTSYLVDLGDGRALVVDPERHPAPYLKAAAERDLKVAYSLETHLHADFVSGSRELAAQGATVVAPAAGGIEFPHRGLVDGVELDLGGLVLRALATPGHTPEHLAYLLLDGSKPLALFSGGSLLVGAVARTDLMSPERTEDLARSLWRSLHERVLSLPDDLAVYPTHGAGSFCSTTAGAQRVTTIGAEKRQNPLLAARDEDTFVRLLLSGFGSYPPYFLRMRKLNRRGPDVYGRAQPDLSPLDVSKVRLLLEEGAQLIDARPVGGYATGHIPGSLSIPLRAQFATWLGWLADPARPLVFLLDDSQDRSEVVRQALNIGYENLAGEIGGGIDAWRAAGEPVGQMSLVDATDVTGPVLDIRQDAEYEAGHVPGASHIELGALSNGAAVRGPVTVMCGHGERAMTGASLLRAHGVTDVTVAVGGPRDWSDATGRPLENGE
jgi:glyoxylase-like metal-dependent hydrolase (beta-lactamase superfamily II)/rhodanese-related sulfurtransferase